MKQPKCNFSRRASRGVGLIEAMVAIVVMMLGTLAMAQFQARALIQGNDAQTRMSATQMADELLNLALADPGNAACYTVPAAGTCGSTPALTYTEQWARRAGMALPQPGTASSTLDPASGQLTVVLGWTGKDAGAGHELRMVTDVRQ